MLRSHISIGLTVFAVWLLACGGVTSFTSSAPTATATLGVRYVTPTPSTSSPTDTQPAIALNTPNVTSTPLSPTATPMQTTIDTSTMTPIAPTPIPPTPELSNLAATPISSAKCSIIPVQYPIITLSSNTNTGLEQSFQSDLGPAAEPQNEIPVEISSFEPRHIQVQELRVCLGSIDNFLGEISGTPQYALAYPVNDNPLLEKIWSYHNPNYLFIASAVEQISAKNLYWIESYESTEGDTWAEIVPFENSVGKLVDERNTINLEEAGTKLWIDSLVVEQADTASLSNLTTLYMFVNQLPMLDCDGKNPVHNRGISCRVDSTSHLISSEPRIVSGREEARTILREDDVFLAEYNNGETKDLFLCDAQRCYFIIIENRPGNASSAGDRERQRCSFLAKYASHC